MVRTIGQMGVQMRYMNMGKSYQSRSGRLCNGGPCSICHCTESSQFRNSRSGVILCNKCGLKEQRRLKKEQMPCEVEKETSSSDVSCHSATKILSGPLLTTPSSMNQGKKCCFCHTEVSPLWRSIDDKLACNACGLRNKRLRERDRLNQAQEEEAQPAARKLRRVSMSTPSDNLPLVPRLRFRPVQQKLELFVPAPSLTTYPGQVAQKVGSQNLGPQQSRDSGTGHRGAKFSPHQEHPLHNAQSDIKLLRIFLDYLIAARASTWGHVLSPTHVELYIFLWSSLETTQQEEGKNALLSAWVSKDAATAAAQHVLFILERHGLFSFQQLSKAPAV